MTTRTYQIKHNDANQLMTIYLTNDDDSAIDVSEASEIKFHCGMTDETAIVDEDVDVVGDGTDGIVTYRWTAEDTANEPGEYNAEVQITWPDDTIKTTPTKLGEAKVVIYDEVA